MAVLTKKSRGYICGLVLFVIGTVAFVTGFATSRFGIFTFSVSSRGSVYKCESYLGLWAACSEIASGNVHCVDVEPLPDWMMCVRGLQCSALSIIFLSLCYAGVVNCLLDNAKFLRVLEMGTGISGVLGLVGAVVFAAKAKTKADTVGALVSDIDMDFSVGWSFGVNVGGAVVILLSSVLIAYFNKPLHALAATISPGMVFSTIDGVPTGNNPYNTLADAYPLPTYITLQNQVQCQGQVQPVVIAMPNSQTKY